MYYSPLETRLDRPSFHFPVFLGIADHIHCSVVRYMLCLVRFSFAGSMILYQSNFSAFELAATVLGAAVNCEQYSLFSAFDHTSIILENREACEMGRRDLAI